MVMSRVAPWLANMSMKWLPKLKFHYADFPETSPSGKFRGSRCNGILAKEDVRGLSRTCRGRHGEVGILEFGP